MPRLKSNPGVVHSLYGRELLLSKSPYRATLKILKCIVCSETTTFRKVWEIGSKKSILYTDRKLFIENYKKCFALCGVQSLPSRLYEINYSQYGKVEDSTIYSTAVHEAKFQDPNCYKPFLLALMSSNWLSSYNSDTGQQLDSVYLGPLCVYKYRHVDWDRQGETITVMSGKTNVKAGPAMKNRVLVTIAWFSVMPLKFLALMEFDKEVFGKECTHCNVSEGLLIVGTGSFNSGMVRLYDFYETIDSGIMYRCDIGKPCDALNGDEVGRYPGGLPLNCKVKEAPPILFQVQCSEHTLHFGCYPFHFVTSLPKNPEIFQVYDVATHKMVENGKIDIPNSSVDKCHITFHGDDSGRIIHYTDAAIRFFSLMENEEGIRRLRQCFMINLEEPATLKETKRPARQNTRRMFRDEITIVDRTLLGDDYENETDIFGVLSTTTSGEGDVATIRLYDNATGKEVKRLDIDLPYDEFSDYDLVLDLDSIMVIVKDCQGRCKCVLYQMHSLLNLDEGRQKRNIRRRTRSKR